MVREFGNCIDDSSEGGFSRDEGTGPSNVPSEMKKIMIVMIVVITMMIMKRNLRRIQRKNQLGIRPRKKVLSMRGR